MEQSKNKSISKSKKEFPKAYAVKHNKLETRCASRSGGVFTAISDYVLNLGGVVYGCALDEKFMAQHIRTTTREERDTLRGSKYVQSTMNDIFSLVKKDILKGYYVLFSGTPCQIAGIKMYLSAVDCSKFIALDIICYGVPSAKVWFDYLNWSQKKHKEEIVGVDFRNKLKYGWKAHVEALFTNKREINSRIYTTLFQKRLIIRPSCFQCPYKSTVRSGDITIGDFWGIDKAVPGFSDDKGVSLVLINNEAGNEYFNSVLSELEVVECTIKESMQSALVGAFEVPIQRKKFWEDYKIKSFSYIVSKYGGNNLKNKVRRLKNRVRNKIIVMIKRGKI